MKRDNLTHKIIRLAIFLALGIVFNIVESLLPLPIPLPGVRLGLANTMGLIVLYYYSPKEFLAIGFLRVFFVGLLRTGIGSVAFTLSLSGWALSSLIVLIVYFFHKVSIYGLSIISAIFHSVGQIVMVMILYELPSMINYLFLLLLSSAISGFLVAIISARVIALLNRIFNVSHVKM